MGQDAMSNAAGAGLFRDSRRDVCGTALMLRPELCGVDWPAELEEVFSARHFAT
jgi:hypothetical protein